MGTRGMEGGHKEWKGIHGIEDGYRDECQQ